MLFSEPKIPQFCPRRCWRTRRNSFSALQRAENSSIVNFGRDGRLLFRFQCSSASRKFLNFLARVHPIPRRDRFSALQRAENSSMLAARVARAAVLSFSALQRAENSSIRSFAALSSISVFSFSALQRAENSSIPFECAAKQQRMAFQCSSASRKFLNSPTQLTTAADRAVSVLFSEPKIPQSRCSTDAGAQCWRFSALQRAENSSIIRKIRDVRGSSPFQCSSASRKFLNRIRGFEVFEELLFQCSSASRKFLNREAPDGAYLVECCFSALQRAENSSIVDALQFRFVPYRGFSALQRAENSSIQTSFPTLSNARGVSVLFSEPKIPQSHHRNKRKSGVVSFSALQRAENSSIERRAGDRWRVEGFSALQRAENSSMGVFSERDRIRISCFSALQRAENSSIGYGIR